MTFSSAREPEISTDGPVAGTEQDDSTRKRVELGLSPRRPTAKPVTHRPPDTRTVPLPPTLLILLLNGVVLVTLLLVLVTVESTPAWLQSVRNLFAQKPVIAFSGATSILTTTALQLPSSMTLHISENFSSDSVLFTTSEEPGQWRMGPAQDGSSYYQIVAWPNRLAWSVLLLEMPQLQSYVVQSAIMVDPSTSEGYGGVIARFSDPENFVFFVINGKGEYQVQVREAGELSELKDWTPSPFLHPAGNTNMIALEDTGTEIHFIANQMLLFSAPSMRIPRGDVGLVGGAQADGISEVLFGWFQLLESAN
jgi:hypothetical protein